MEVILFILWSNSHTHTHEYQTILTAKEYENMINRINCNKTNGNCELIWQIDIVCHSHQPSETLFFFNFYLEIYKLNTKNSPNNIGYSIGIAIVCISRVTNLLFIMLIDLNFFIFFCFSRDINNQNWSFIMKLWLDIYKCFDLYHTAKTSAALKSRESFIRLSLFMIVIDSKITAVSIWIYLFRVCVFSSLCFLWSIS